MPSVRIQTLFQVDGEQHSALSAEERLECAGVYLKNLLVHENATESFPLQIDLPLTAAIFITVDAPVEITLSKLQLTLQAAEAFRWTRGSGVPCPLEVDSKEIVIRNSGPTPARIFIRVPELSRPEVAAPAAVPSPEASAPLAIGN